MYYPPETRVTPLTIIERERLLTVPGEVLVQAGERVEPGTVVARAALSGKLYVIKAARILSVQDDELTDYMLDKGIGDFLEAGEPIAVKKGLFRSTCRSPVNGRLAAITKGELLIVEPASSLFELRAYIYGQVKALRPDYGVLIETTGALIQGLWGIGGETFGVLKMLVDDPAQAVEPEAVDAGCHGAIIVGGASAAQEVLRQAEQVRARGVIVGGLDASLRDASFPFPVIATEGVGRIPISSPIFELLQANAGQEVSLSAKTQLRWNVIRPEIIIPVSTDETPVPEPTDEVALKEGVQVRITRQPYLGVVGVVTGPAKARSLDSGARLRGAEVELEGGQKVFVPWANLELIR
jgi:hypothetical protein